MFINFKFILFFYVLGPITADYPYVSLSGTCTIPRLEHGKVKVRQRARLIKFMCLARYTLVGNSYATCRNGEWDVPKPVCIRPGCPDIPEIENGLQIPSFNNAWIIHFCLPGYKLKGSPVVYCDGRRWNASAPVCVDSNVSTPLSCDFEEPDLCGWTNSEQHDFDWERINTATPSSFLKTGPSFDHTYGKGGSGYYMYIETTSKYENDTARLLSPIYDRKLLQGGCFSFFYHMYGDTTGGLKVYIKPDFLELEQLINPREENKKYNLFEKWGNMGDVWYNSVTQLPDVMDNFQIVIEGIRGNGYTSDIAIDDVAILQGNSCTSARQAAVTPPMPLVDSCAKRCFTNDTQPLGCSCSKYCFLHDSCCHDFFDICIFQADSITTDTSDSTDASEIVPQTQKLIATTPETTSTSTTTTTTPKTTTTSTSTTTSTTTTTTTTTTTPRPTTIKTTQRTTTKKVTTPSTTTRTTTTTKKPTTVKPIAKTTKIIQTTTKAIKTTAQTVQTTTKPAPTSIPITIKTTTNMPFGISRTIENHNDYNDIVEKARKEKEVEIRKITHVQSHDSKANSTSGWKIFLIVLGVIACVGATSWVIMVARSSRGSMTIARLRGHINHDPEVRFLSTDIDDD